MFRHPNPFHSFSPKHQEDKSHPCIFIYWSTKVWSTDLWTSEFQYLIPQMAFPCSKTGSQQGWEHTPHYTEVWLMAHGNLEKKGTGLDVKLHAMALNWEEWSVADVCQSETFRRHRSRALVYSHGVGTGRRESTTVYGHISAETLNDDLTPEDFNNNIWSLSHINRISFSLSLTHIFTEI